MKSNQSTVTLGHGFIISYTVSDLGGSHLNGVELWRGQVSDKGNESWTQVATVSLSGDGPVSGIFPMDIPPDPGTYKYGLHVTDHAGNIIYENQSGFSPISVTVVP